jgi:hypothetical protein
VLIVRIPKSEIASAGRRSVHPSSKEEIRFGNNFLKLTAVE